MSENQRPNSTSPRKKNISPEKQQRIRAKAKAKQVARFEAQVAGHS